MTHDTFETEIKRGPIAWMAGNSVAANLIMVVFLIGGLIWANRVKQEVFPEFETDTVTISVAYPGASPEEVEQGIILAAEEAVQGLDGIDEVTSSAREGSGTVTVKALQGADLQKLAQDVQNEVDRITSFPEDSEKPQVEISTHRHEVVSLVVYGDQDEHLLRETAEHLRDGLLQEPGITQVDLSGIRDLEISIEVPQANLRTYNLTLEEIARRVGNNAVELAGGQLKTQAGEILVRMKERRDWGREFGRIPIITANDGTVVLLDDIASVIDGFEDSDYQASYNGKPAVMVDVYRVGEQTPIAVSRAVNHYLDRVRPSLAPGIFVESRNDRSEVYRQRLDLLMTNGYVGLGLVFIFLGFFLELRLAFWVAMGIPVSFLGSLLFLPALGVSINMMSMFAFIIALGIVVDDAIVVGENIYHYRQAGMPFQRGTIRGAKEVAMPVTFSILTNITLFTTERHPGRHGERFSRPYACRYYRVFIISLVKAL